MQTKRHRIKAILAATLLAASVPTMAANLLTNGSFESPAISYGSWNVYSSISGWTGTNCGIEIQNHVAGSPYDGDQHVELDSNCSSDMYQDVTTGAGAVYLLTYYYSPRPGVADNAIQVSWDGNVIANLQADGTADPDTVWETRNHLVQATGVTTTLRFDDTGFNDSVGGYLDNASLSPLDTPKALCGAVKLLVDNNGIANSLCAKLNAATAAIARGNMTAKAGALGAFVNEVEAQTDKAIGAADAALLAAAASQL